MPVFEVERNGQVFEIEAPDIQSAGAAFQNYQPPPSGPQATPGFHQVGPTVGGVSIELPGQASPEAPQHTPGYDKALSQMMVREANLNHGMGGAKGPLDALNSGTGLGFADELAGGLEAARVMGKRLFGQDPGYSPREAYDASRDAYNMQRERFGDEHPVANIGLQLAGGMAVPGAGAAGRFIGGAPNLAGAALRSGAVGAAYGAASGVGNADGGLADRAAGGGKGALLGAAVGGAIPVVARGVGAAVNAGSRALQPRAIPGASSKANQVLADVIDPAAAQRLQDLGPEAMLVDAGPSALGVAQGVTTRPGSGKDAVVAALANRNQGANARLAGDVDQAIGPAVVPSQVEAGFQAGRRALSPQYEQALEGAQPVNLSSADQILQREAASAKGGIATALDGVRGMLAGPNGGLDDTARGALSIRQALDDMIGSAQGNERRILTMLRQEVNGALQEAAPNIRQLDDQFRGLMQQSEALETGQTLLDSGRTAIRPQELGEMMAGNAPETNTALRQGARAEIDRLTGTKANDLVALRNAVKGEGDWNRARLAQVFGDNEAQRIVGAVDREAAFASAYNRLTQNSETASRQGGAKFLDQQSAPSLETPQTLMGAGVATAKKLAQAVLGNRNSNATDALANELGPILVARGAEREALVRQLLAGNARTAQGRMTAEQSRRLSEYLLRGAPQAAAGAIADQPKAQSGSKRP